MPWLAPIGTPRDSGAGRKPGADLAIHPRVEIVAGSAFTRGKPCVSIESPFSACASA